MPWSGTSWSNRLFNKSYWRMRKGCKGDVLCWVHAPTDEYRLNITHARSCRKIITMEWEIFERHRRPNWCCCYKRFVARFIKFNGSTPYWWVALYDRCRVLLKHVESTIRPIKKVIKIMYINDVVIHACKETYFYWTSYYHLYTRHRIQFTLNNTKK